MNEQNIPQPNESVQSSKHIWITIIAVVLTAIIVGGGVYAWQKSSLRATEQSLQQQITDLQNQIVNLQKPTQPAVTTPEETQEPTQPADESASWKTYTNSKHNYSFKYPSDWLLGDSPGSITPSPTADDVAFDSPLYTAARFTVQVTSASDCSDIEDCVAKNRKSFTSDQQTTGTYRTTIGNKSALSETITRPTSGNWKYYVWYVLEGGKLYTLHTISLATDDNVTKPTFNQILSTLKFTK